MSRSVVSMAQVPSLIIPTSWKSRSRDSSRLSHCRSIVAFSFVPQLAEPFLTDLHGQTPQHINPFG